MAGQTSLCGRMRPEAPLREESGGWSPTRRQSSTAHPAPQATSRNGTLRTLMACPEGLEPPTYCLEGNCSIQLSYRHKMWRRELESNQ